ncbi:MAG: TlpA disulfide reductase family protein [Thermodesulfovibrionia bacterium]|nr:TlpA disulfide reductase family protein [Thermodesulfovibrionia bacterium]
MKNLKISLFTLILVAALGLIVVYESVNAEDLIPWKGDRVIGSQAADFTIKDLKGNDVTLSSFKGKPVLLNIWATWCPYCRKERAELNELYKEYNGKGLVIISVANDRSIEKVKQYIKNNPASYMVLSDEDSIVTDAYSVYGLPTNFLIDRNGIIKNKFSGFRSWTDPESKKLLEEFIK